MKVQPEITYRGFQPMEAQIEAVDRHITQFEKAFPHTTSLTVVITCPPKHHRHGELFEISIRARMPTGKEVDVTHQREDDERYADFYFALNDSFKRARRQLKDKATRLRGEVKSHANSTRLPAEQ